MTRKEALVRLVAGANGFGAFANDEPARLVRWCVDQLAEIEKACGEETCSKCGDLIDRMRRLPEEMRLAADQSAAVQREKDAKIAEPMHGAWGHRIAAAIRAGGES